MKTLKLRNVIAVVTGALMLVGAEVTVASANPGGTAPAAANLLCFSGTTDGFGYGGTCAITSRNGTTATLTLNGENANGDYAGVYLHKANLAGVALGNVTQLGYTYSDNGGITPTPGDLSLNIGIDTNGDGLTNAYAYVDAYYCPGTGGVVSVTSDQGCGIVFNDTLYSNWAALVAANPGDTVATDGLPFIVAEQTPNTANVIWDISNVNMGKAS